MTAHPPLLSVDRLSVRVPSGALIVNDVSFTLEAGQTLGLIGASGCGKSTLAQALVGLLAPSAGQIRLKGRPIAEVARTHGPAWPVQIVFQDPQSSLNPRRRVWQLITEPLYIAGQRDRKALKARAAELGENVGIGPHQLDRFAHEFSGGQRQRIAIARALASDARILVLDEPTSALDISVQAQILNLIVRLQERFGMACLFISHNVAVVRHLCDRVAVMAGGELVETGMTDTVFNAPAHDATRQLLAAAPTLTSPTFAEEE